MVSVLTKITDLPVTWTVTKCFSIDMSMVLLEAKFLGWHQGSATVVASIFV